MYDDREIWREIQEMKADIRELREKNKVVSGVVNDLETVHTEINESIDKMRSSIEELRGLTNTG